MSAPTLSMQELPLEARRIAVSFRLLLGLYAIIPLCVLLQLLDSWFWQGVLQANLPSSPTHLLLFQILFGTPHIIASSILLASNRDQSATGYLPRRNVLGILEIMSEFKCLGRVE